MRQTDEIVQLTRIENHLTPHHLTVTGGLHETVPTGRRTVLLIGHVEPGFWQHFKTCAEWQDGKPDPIDRWSGRVLSGIASDLGAEALFPFGGPPWHPFYRWAIASGHAFVSPVRLLVGAGSGLFASFRGALAFSEQLPLPPSQPRPCDSCAEQPCLDACPVGALTAAGYDIQRCHAFLDTGDGADCMNNGCAVRRACPLSLSYARLAEQSAYHMRQFHK